jgi:(p)ppGpp synthase/HD superfamily hydrolase
MTENPFANEETHDDFMEGAIQIPQQPALEIQIRLGARKQVLHNVAETGTAAHEFDHAARNARKKNITAE